jgi:hypothetical protein
MSEALDTQVYVFSCVTPCSLMSLSSVAAAGALSLGNWHAYGLGRSTWGAHGYKTDAKNGGRSGEMQRGSSRPCAKK